MRSSSTMRKGRCIHCESNEIYTIAGSGSNRTEILPITLFSTAILKTYVCANCGCVERYLEDKAKLEKIKEKWSRVDSLSRT